ncbi:MAG: SRPBCC family protein [Chloroflexota bacterium]
MVTEPKKHDLVVTRVFAAPVEQVWNAWSDAEQVKRWWGPVGFTAPLARMDFREGGTSLVCMSSPEYGDLYNIWTYREIRPPRKIDFIQSPADKDGNKVDPALAGMPPDVPPEVRTVVALKNIGDNMTEMTVTEFGYTSVQVLALSKAGLEECLDKMAGLFDKA